MQGTQHSDAALDRLVLEKLEERIFAPERLEFLLRGLIDRARNKTADDALKAEEPRKKLQATETRVERLYAALADGTVTDTTVFRWSLSQVENEREEIVRSIAALEKRQDVPRHLLTKDNIGRFAAAARERLRGEDAALRKGYVRQFVERIEVDDHEIGIIGPTASLAGGVPGSGHATASGVPSFDKVWWCWQSAANSSPPEFPANREIYSEFARFAATCFGLDCTEVAKAQAFSSPAGSHRQELSRELSASYQGTLAP